VQGFGCKDRIELDNRKFQVHTGCDPDKERIVTEVFEEGRYLFGESRNYPTRRDDQESINETYLKTVVSKLHTSILDEIDVIFHAHNKLKEKKDHFAHYRMGKVLLSRNFYEEAVENFQRSVKLNTDFIRGYKLLAIAYLKAGKYMYAIETFEEALKLKPDFPDLINGLGIAHSFLGNFDKASEYYQETLKINPNYMESHFNLGVSLFLGTLLENPNEQNIVIPVRIIRTLKQFRKQEVYQSTYWQNLFDESLEIINSADKDRIILALQDLQLKLSSKEDDIAAAMDFFFIKFMYGGKMFQDEEMAYYEKRISEEAEKHSGYADYWNELGTLHLIQCRDYFLRAMNEIGKAVEINKNYDEAVRSMELMKNSKKGFLILLRAILK